MSIHSSFKHTHLRINHQKYTWRHASFVSLISKSISRWARFGGGEGREGRGASFFCFASYTSAFCGETRRVELIEVDEIEMAADVNVRFCERIEAMYDHRLIRRLLGELDFTVGHRSTFFSEPHRRIHSVLFYSIHLQFPNHLITSGNMTEHVRFAFFPPQCECEKIA